MIRCNKCSSISVKVCNLNFAKRKVEGCPSSKIVSIEKQYYCQSCGNAWFYNPKCDELYAEYLKLKPETTLVAHIVKPGGTYKAQYIDPNKLIRRNEIAKTLVDSYQHVLNVDPGEWYELCQDAL